MVVRSRRRTSALGRHLPDALTGKSRPKAEVHDCPLSEGRLTPIRIRTHDKWSRQIPIMPEKIAIALFRIVRKSGAKEIPKQIVYAAWEGCGTKCSAFEPTHPVI